MGVEFVQLLGVNVQRHRKLNGMSQERLALDVGMECGMRNPSVRALVRLAYAVGVEPRLRLEIEPILLPASASRSDGPTI